MFEKESEEYAVLNARQYIHNEDIGFCTSEEEVRQAYQKCAEFGYNKEKRELEEENAELKEQCLILADCDTCYSPCKNDNVEMKKQLTKAKEIIGNLLGLLPDEVLYHDFYNRAYVAPAEQFISEVEL